MIVRSSGLGSFPQVIALCGTLLLVLAHEISLSATHGCIVGEHGHVTCNSCHGLKWRHSHV